MEILTIVLIRSNPIHFYFPSLLVVYRLKSSAHIHSLLRSRWSRKHWIISESCRGKGNSIRISPTYRTLRCRPYKPCTSTSLSCTSTHIYVRIPPLSLPQLFFSFKLPSRGKPSSYSNITMKPTEELPR